MDDGSLITPHPEKRPSFLKHNHPFDPSHGYDLQSLLRVTVPPEPADFASFWQARYAKALQASPDSTLAATGEPRHGWRIFDWSFRSLDGTSIKGWALLPVKEEIHRAFIIGHGYGGLTEPDLNLPLPNAALFFPCFRGLGLSQQAGISSNPARHVLHQVDNQHQYVIGGCVDDLWLAVTAVLQHFPQTAEHLGYLGISFGGGIGALALPWDSRMRQAHLNVPTFGNQELRLELGSVGSAASVQHYWRRHPEVHQVLRYYDAASAAKYLHQPTHCACALFDPAVAPAGQFAIYNQLAGSKTLFVLTAGHHDYPGKHSEDRLLRQEIQHFFRGL